MVAVNHENLVWARMTAGLEVSDELAKKIFGDSKSRSAKEKLELVELGELKPSRAQLSKMAKLYHQPLLALYLNKPPQRGNRGKDFRTLSQRSVDPKGNARLDILLRNVIAAQSLVRDLLEEEELDPLPFVGSASFPPNEHKLATEIIHTLDFSLTEFRSKTTIREAFAYLRNCIESRRVFVLLLGEIDHLHTTSIPVDVFRGFTLSDSLAPFIVINRKDAKSAWSFTAFHELAHLWLGNTGIIGTTSDSVPEIEAYCNRVARQILLPNEELYMISDIRAASFDESVTIISAFAKPRKLSRSMVAYNLRLEGLLTWPRWRELQDLFDEQRIAQELRDRERNKARGGGPNSNVVVRSTVGPLLCDLAKRSIDSGVLSPTKAGIILGVNPRRVESIVNPQ